MSILEKLAAGHTFGGGPEDAASFQADQDEAGDPRLQMQYTPEMNDEMTQALMRIIQERATQPPPEEKPKGMNPILKGALGGGGVGALGGAGVGALLGGASKGWLDTPAMMLGGAGAGALAGGAGGALGAHLARPKEASYYEQGYFDALAKLGYDSKKLQMIGGPAAVNPKATAGGTKSQVVLPKGRKSKGGTAKSDAGF